MKLRALIGSGDKITRFTLPFLVGALALNIARPSLFAVRGPRAVLRAASAVVLAVGVVTWLWSATLVLTKARKGKLITSGPFAVVKHPLYTSISLLVLPGLSILFGSWLGVLVGGTMYAGVRRYAPEEERALAETFGSDWDDYRAGVKVPWL